MAKKTKKSQTLAEFKAWLQGITEIQPANWAPDAAQWKMIKDRIDNIEEIIAPQPAPLQAIPTGPIYRQAPGPVVTAGPPIPSSLEEPPQRKQTRRAPPAMQQAVEGKIKTPDIDTSDGSYDSSFA